MVRSGKKSKQALTTYRNIITYNLTTCTVYTINIAVLRIQSTSWQLLSLLVFFYLQQLVTLWLQLLLLMSIVSVNLCWCLAVNKVVIVFYWYVRIILLKQPLDKGKGLPQQAEVAQRVQGRLRPRIFLTFGTMRVVGHQPYAPAAFTPGEIPGTHL